MRSSTILCSILLFACGGGDSVAPARVEAEGVWSGVIRDNGGTAAGTLVLTLSETNGAVTGNGNVTTASDAFAITTTGTYAPPSLSLTVRATGFQDMNLTATVGETNMTGTLNGSGFLNSGITLNRN